MLDGLNSRANTFQRIFVVIAHGFAWSANPFPSYSSVILTYLYLLPDEYPGRLLAKPPVAKLLGRIPAAARPKRVENEQC